MDTRKTKPGLEAWNSQLQPLSHPPQKEKGLQVKLILDHACTRKPAENPKSMGLDEAPGWQTQPRVETVTEAPGPGAAQTSPGSSLHLAVHSCPLLLTWASLVAQQ